MPCTVAWYPGHEGRVIHQVFSGSLTVADVTSGIEAINAYISEGVPPVHVLVDVGNLQSFPKSVTQFKQSASQFKGPGVGYIVMIGASSVMNMFAGLIAQFGGVKLRGFHSEDEALEFIAQHDPSLVHE